MLLIVLALILSGSGVSSLEETCTSNVDCVTTSNSICENGICGCDAMSYYSTQFDSCLSYATQFKEFCLETQQCVGYIGDNSTCNRNYCMCEENYRWFQGKCQPYVAKGEACTSRFDCYDGYDPIAMDCISGTCVCSDGYYDRGQDCRISAAAGTACAINFDCQDEGYNTCYRGKCESLAAVHARIIQAMENPIIIYKHVAKRSIAYWNENMTMCAYDDDCRNITNAECISDWCLCRVGYYDHDGHCLKGLAYCNNDDGCTMKNAMCFLNTSCVCKPGYFLDGNEICTPELGVADPSYIDKSNCTNITGAQRFVNNTCYCMEFWNTDDTNRKCIKTSTQQFDTCMTNEWCNFMGPYSYCQFTSGTTGHCQCSSFAELNTTTYVCEKYSEMSNSSCLRDKDCSFNEVCRNEKCECVVNFREDESGTCMPVIDGSCEERACSLVENSKCSGGYCMCSQHTIFNDTLCLKIADKLNEPCEMDVQCDDLNGVCNGKTDKKKCVCKKNYMEVSDVLCMENKEYGDPCMKETDCTMVINRSFQCRNSICQCPVNHTVRNGYCTSVATNVIVNYTMFTLCVVIAWMAF